MERDRLNACKQRKADFVLLQAEQKELIAQVKRYGYYPCAMPANVYDCVVLSKHPLPQSLRFMPVSNADVLLKRPLRLDACQGHLQRSRSIQTGKKRAKLAIFSRKICGK